MRIDVAIVGGTGVGERLRELGGSALHVPTPCGLLRGAVLELDRRAVLLLNRHAAGHRLPPHRVGYAAMAHGLAALGVRTCLATAAVGGLRSDWPTGTLVVCSDFLDFSGRNLTLFDRRVVHRDFSTPFDPDARAALLRAGEANSIPLRDGGVYVGAPGPRYETPAEIEAFRRLGGDVAGMTAASEAVVMREAGVAYAVLAIVTNPAAGLSPTPLDHEEVVREMSRSGDRALALLTHAARELGARA